MFELKDREGYTVIVALLHVVCIRTMLEEGEQFTVIDLSGGLEVETNENIDTISTRIAGAFTMVGR